MKKKVLLLPKKDHLVKFRWPFCLTVRMFHVVCPSLKQTNCTIYVKRDSGRRNQNRETKFAKKNRSDFRSNLCVCFAIPDAIAILYFIFASGLKIFPLALFFLFNLLACVLLKKCIFRECSCFLSCDNELKVLLFRVCLVETDAGQ